MKKTFKLTATNKAPARQVDSVKHEIKKYIARERKKTLSDNVDFWDFNCKIGASESTAAITHVAEINKEIDALVTGKAETFYLEILAKKGYRNKK